GSDENAVRHDLLDEELARDGVIALSLQELRREKKTRTRPILDLRVGPGAFPGFRDPDPGLPEGRAYPDPVSLRFEDELEKLGRRDGLRARRGALRLGEIGLGENGRSAFSVEALPFEPECEPR